MRAETEMVAETFIVFDNGAKEKASSVIKYIEEMVDADYTHFNTRIKLDEALLALVREKCGENISHEVDFSDTSIRVYWDGDQDEALEKLLDEISQEVDREEEERNL